MSMHPFKNRDIGWFPLWPVLGLLLAGCSSAPAPAAFGGTWKPVNTFAPHVQPIAQTAPRLHVVHPLDGSLRGLLTRWAREEGLALDYRLFDDFTLPVAAAHIREATLAEAVHKLQALYAPHGIRIALPDNSRTLLVLPRNDAATPVATQVETSSAAASGQPAVP